MLSLPGPGAWSGNEGPARHTTQPKTKNLPLKSDLEATFLGKHYVADHYSEELKDLRQRPQRHLKGKKRWPPQVTSDTQARRPSSSPAEECALRRLRRRRTRPAQARHGSQEPREASAGAAHPSPIRHPAFRSPAL